MEKIAAVNILFYTIFLTLILKTVSLISAEKPLAYVLDIGKMQTAILKCLWEIRKPEIYLEGRNESAVKK